MYRSVYYVEFSTYGLGSWIGSNIFLKIFSTTFFISDHDSIYCKRPEFLLSVNRVRTMRVSIFHCSCETEPLFQYHIFSSELNTLYVHVVWGRPFSHFLGSTLKTNIFSHLFSSILLKCPYNTKLLFSIHPFLKLCFKCPCVRIIPCKSFYYGSEIFFVRFLFKTFGPAYII